MVKSPTRLYIEWIFVAVERYLKFQYRFWICIGYRKWCIFIKFIHYKSLRIIIRPHSVTSLYLLTPYIMSPILVVDLLLVESNVHTIARESLPDVHLNTGGDTNMSGTMDPCANGKKVTAVAGIAGCLSQVAIDSGWVKLPSILLNHILALRPLVRTLLPILSQMHFLNDVVWQRKHGDPSGTSAILQTICKILQLYSLPASFAMTCIVTGSLVRIIYWLSLYLCEKWWNKLLQYCLQKQTNTKGTYACHNILLDWALDFDIQPNIEQER